MALIEAMLCGLPIVATAVGGIVDSISHETTGLLVEERDPSGIASAVLRLVREPLLAEQMVRNAREKARREFTREASALAFSTLFSDVLHGRRETTE